MTDHIGQLKPDPRNARRHTSRNVGMIVDALHEVGAARSVVIDEDNVILAGNATVDAAAQAGIERVRVIDADGDELIAVRRSNLTPEQKTRLALFDNRAAEFAEWDESVLASLVEDTDLSGIFRDDELAELLASLNEPTAGLTDPDAVPEPPADPITKPGDLWVLGRHRLLCGDATVAADVERLMDGERASLLLTYPPYAVAYIDKARDMNRRGYGHSRAKSGAAIQGDEIDDAGASQLWRDAFVTAAMVALDDHAAWYVWHAQGRAMLTLYNLLAEIGLLHHQTIIWVKNNFVIGRSDYQWIHEPCFYGWRQGNRPLFLGAKSQTTVWDVSRDTTSPLHPTQKPVEIFTRPIANHCKADDIVFDPFLGSGTTVIAAEQHGATCYGIEVSPSFCDVIINRFEQFTGGTAHRATAQTEAAD